MYGSEECISFVTVYTQEEDIPLRTVTNRPLELYYYIFNGEPQMANRSVKLEL